jgi:L-lactate dehydrogenase complex protein LldG
MSAVREAVLGRLREAIGRSEDERQKALATVEARLAARAPNLIPARGRLDPEGRIALFREMVEAVNGEVRRLPELGEVAAAVTAYLREHNLPQRVVVAPDPRLDGAGWDGQPLLRVRRDAAQEDDITGVTLAMAGIAETGTLLLTSAAERPSLLAFLPENSIVVVRVADIDGAYEESWARLRALGPPPRSVNFITGPSRTGDIAQKIELGAHGPRRLLVLIVDEDAA